MSSAADIRAEVLSRCQDAIPAWRDLGLADFDMDDPKGFSSFTIGVRCRRDVEPAAVLYRQLEGKENAILDFEAERAVFLLLGDAEIAATCLRYEPTHRIEAFYRGRTLSADDVFDPDIQRGVAAELHRFHQLRPDVLPDKTFFELITDKWTPLAQAALDRRSELPPDERDLCGDLEAVTSPETVAKVLRCLPERAPVFCHNDTYHGNVFLLDDGTVKLLDFEFSCLNHAAFDFANFFAETLMEHGLPDRPHFRIGEPRFDDDDLRRFIGFYLDHEAIETVADRQARANELLAETKHALLLSDYMYAVAGITLALDPIQKLRFIPYAHQRFTRFLRRWDETFGDD